MLQNRLPKEVCLAVFFKIAKPQKKHYHDKKKN